MSTRRIIHCDMDAFYVSCELREKPELANLPVAVGGSRDHRGVISTCNYIARRFGVRSAMSTQLALAKCPNLVVLPSNSSLYREISGEIKEIFFDYSDLVEPLSLDEAYIDVSDSTHLKGSATLIAQEMRQRIYEKTQLTASAGVSNCKFIAKIASDINKPNGLFVVPPDQVNMFVRDLDLRKIPGVGKSTIEKLNTYGFYTCYDIRKSSQENMVKHFGKFGNALWDRSHGIDLRPVEPNRDRKSVGIESTYSNDLTAREDCLRALLNFRPELDKRSKKHLIEKDMHKLKVKVKFSDFESITCECTADKIYDGDIAMLLDRALERQNGRSIRLLGLTIGLKEKEKIAQVTFDF